MKGEFLPHRGCVDQLFTRRIIIDVDEIVLCIY